MPAFSIIIPSYNRAHTLPKALDSVLAQTHAAFEIILVDDGSSDDTEQLARQYPGIKYIRQENKGVSSARNTGIKRARGDWIALLDSDDEWTTDKLERQAEYIQQNPKDHIIHTNEKWIRKGIFVNQMKKHQKYGGDIFEHCLPLCAISPSSVCIHQSVFENIGLFDTSLPACEDYDFWLRACSKYTVGYLDTPLTIKYGGHDDQLSKKYWGMDRFRIQSLIRILESGQLNQKQYAMTQTILDKKIRIYLKGAAKRGRLNEINEMLEDANSVLTSRINMEDLVI